MRTLVRPKGGMLREETSHRANVLESSLRVSERFPSTDFAFDSLCARCLRRDSLKDVGPAGSSMLDHRPMCRIAQGSIASNLKPLGTMTDHAATIDEQRQIVERGGGRGFKDGARKRELVQQKG